MSHIEVRVATFEFKIAGKTFFGPKTGLTLHQKNKTKRNNNKKKYNYEKG